MTKFLAANWQNIIMANYEVEPKILQPYLPKGLELDLYHGKAYVSLVGFLFKNTRIFTIPIPLLGTFEEVNLRFYVLKKDTNGTKRGVVFINETVPYSLVAFIANKLYKEHYTAITTRHNWQINEYTKTIEYQWKVAKKWHSMQIIANNKTESIAKNSKEEYIFEHYFGYTKVNELTTIEYKIAHPSWKINQVKDYTIDCDFGAFYGTNFAFLNEAKPASVFLAEGSAIAVDWKRNLLKFEK